MNIVTTVKVTHLGVKDVIAAGLEKLGYVGIDMETLKFSSDCEDRSFTVDYLDESQPKASYTPASMSTTLNKALERR